MRVKAKPRRPKPASSCARRCITSAKANTERATRSRRSQSGFRKPAAQASSCRLPLRERRRARRARRRNRICAAAGQSPFGATRPRAHGLAARNALSARKTAAPRRPVRCPVRRDNPHGNETAVAPRGSLRSTRAIAARWAEPVTRASKTHDPFMNRKNRRYQAQWHRSRSAAFRPHRRPLPQH